jgi:hypothetical protein
MRQADSISFNFDTSGLLPTPLIVTLRAGGAEIVLDLDGQATRPPHVNHWVRDCGV